MKKLLVFSITILIIFWSVTVCANDFKLTVDNKSAKSGETVTINLDLSDNPGFIAALFELTYDRNSLKLIKAEDKGLLSNAIFSQSYEKYPYIMLWNSSSAKNFTKNGTLVTLTFKVADNAKSGNAFIDISYIPDNVYDVDLNNVYLKIENGQIAIEGASSEDVPPTDSAPSSPEEAPPVQSESAPSAPSTISGSSASSSKPSGKTPAKAEPEAPAKTILPFNDVTPENWYFDAVSFVTENKLMNGTSEESFSPDLSLTRAMLVTILHRIEGTPTAESNLIFKDVDKDMYYAEAINWAKSTKIISGINESEFAPNNTITREHIALILYRYANFRKYNTNVPNNVNIAQFNDFSKVSDYATDAIKYAISNELIKGDTSGNLNPSGIATRAEIATILQRFIKLYD